MVEANQLRTVVVDEAKAIAFLAGAEAALVDVPNVTRVENKYDLAYKAAHDVGEAMLAAYGYKATFGPGAHEKIGGTSPPSSTPRRPRTRPATMRSCARTGTPTTTTPGP
jgi:hypothetical protein